MLPWHINNIFIIVFPFQHFIFFYYRKINLFTILLICLFN